jgi:hypothetical protein
MMNSAKWVTSRPGYVIRGQGPGPEVVPDRSEHVSFWERALAVQKIDFWVALAVRVSSSGNPPVTERGADHSDFTEWTGRPDSD